jgi:hypothetical protein
MMQNLAYYYNFTNYDGMVSKEITEIEETNKELKFGEKNKTT